MTTPPIFEEDIRTIVTSLKDDAKRFSGKTILISGGSGFLGRYFVAVFRLLNAEVLSVPCRVISIDNHITSVGSDDYTDPNVEHIRADITKPLEVQEPVDFIIHAAGIASPVYYLKYPIETIESAVLGIKNLLEFARADQKLEGFLSFSSSEIYGDPDPRFVPTPETYHGYVSSVGPRACYDESKRLAETIAVIYHQKYGVPTKIVRPFNVFGPGMAHNDRRVIPMFAYQALNGHPIPVHGDGLQTRTFCYVTDSIAGFLKVLLDGKAGEAYNIGNPDSEISMRDLAALFTKVVPGATYTLIDYPDSYPAGEPQRRCPDLTKAREHLGYSAKVDLMEGLKRFILWAQGESRYTEGPNGPDV